LLFTCRPPGTAIPGRFPGPAHARGKWFSVDIHCHVLCQPARDLVAAANLPPARQRFEAPKTAEVTDEHQARVRPQLLSLEQRLSDMDTMGIDLQAVSPSPAPLYSGLPPDLGQNRGTGPVDVHASDRVYPCAAHGVVASREPNRQSARIDGRGASSD